MEVLLVDDQALTIQVYAASVRKTFDGARVHMAVDLPEAIRRLRATNIFLTDEVVDGVLKRHESRRQDREQSR